MMDFARMWRFAHWRHFICSLRGALWLERGLLTLGVGCMLFCVSVAFRVDAAQRSAARIVAGTSIAGGSGDTSARAVERPRVIGRLEIPELALTVPILSDYDPASLLQGVGHVYGSANPGGLGNLVLAGHRDTFFRPLRRISPGMEIKVGDQAGVYRYLVDGTDVVNPDQVRVLAIGEQPELTLITCFPFEFVGAAPQRFIVHAHLESAAPMRQ